QLRPDLTVAAVLARPQTLTTRPVDVVVEVSELNGDTGATGTVVLSWGASSSTAPVTVAAGGHASATFTGVALAAPVRTELVATLRDVAPAQTDASNDTRSAVVDVTEHELSTPRNVLFPSLGGYGAQFNHHLYAPISSVQIPAEQYPNVEARVKALEPQLVRIFYSDNWEENADGTHPEFPANYASFVKVVELAQETGAIIDISYQNLANARRTPATIAASMKRFADVFEDLVRNHGLTNVRWAEVGNEPNSGAVTLEEYEALYRAL